MSNATLKGGQEPRTAQVRLRARAEVHRRRLARQGGFGLRSLDAISRERVQVWSLALAAWEELDPNADAERSWRAANVVGRALSAVERRLQERGVGGKQGGDVEAYVAANYGNGGQPKGIE